MLILCLTTLICTSLPTGCGSFDGIVFDSRWGFNSFVLKVPQSDGKRLAVKLGIGW
jgi:hypothetical protein